MQMQFGKILSSGRGWTGAPEDQRFIEKRLRSGIAQLAKTGTARRRAGASERVERRTSFWPADPDNRDSRRRQARRQGKDRIG